MFNIQGKLVGTQNLQNLIMQLRKICSHPFLFHIGDFEDESRKLKNPNILVYSGKMLLLDRILPELLKRGHKVLIFSQFTRYSKLIESVLDILSDYCEYKAYKHCRIDGSVSYEERNLQIKQFSSSDDVNIFLLSTRSGGLGINLTASDTVIIFDSDWNPQCDLQAQDRVHRIGQKNPVIIYRFITAGTVENIILDKANNKRKLEKLVIHKGFNFFYSQAQFKGSKGYYRTKNELSVEELEAVLKSSDAELASTGLQYEYKDGVPLPSSLLTDEELGRILDRSAQSYIIKEAENTRFTSVKTSADKISNSFL